MSPVIRISEVVFKRIQKYATPLIDTPDTAIEKLLNLYEGVNAEEQPPNTAGYDKNNIVELNPNNPDDLTHTKILNGIFNGIKVGKWNGLVDVAHIEAKNNLGSYDKLREISISNISEESLNKRGFRYLPDIGISIQGENANKTWKSALNLAQKLNMNIEVTFEWRSNKRSSHPGRIGKLKWNPESN